MSPHKGFSRKKPRRIEYLPVVDQKYYSQKRALYEVDIGD